MADDLGGALLGLTNGLRSTMANVHNLNIAVLHTGSYHSAHNHFVNLRNALKTHWTDDVTKLLQQIYQVIRDLIFLAKSVGQESEQECCVLLQETFHSIGAIEMFCRTCISHNAEIARNVQSAISQLPTLKPHGQAFDISIRPPPSLCSDDTFVRSSFSAVYPDLSSSASSTSSALTDTLSHLTALLRFSVALKAASERVLSEKRHVSEDVRQMCLASWETNRQDLQTAFVALAPIVDAITVEPSVTQPQPRRSQISPECLTPVGLFSVISQRPGSATITTSSDPTAQSPTYANTRDSSHCLVASIQENLDVVPSSCWKGFFFRQYIKKRVDYPTASAHTH